MMFRRKHLPEGVSAFLEAAQILPAHGQLLTSGARGRAWSFATRCSRAASSALRPGIPSMFVSGLTTAPRPRSAKHLEKVAAADAVRKRADDEKIARAQAEVEGRVWVPSDPSQQRRDLVVHRTDTRPGLAWAPIAGQLLPVEASVRAGSGIVTCDGAMAALLGQPAGAALSYVADHAAELVPGLDHDWFPRHDVRIFQPYGGMPAGDAAADAASAGLAIVATLVSLLGGHLVRTDVALTGAVAGSGELLAVRDLSKKARAAQRAYTKYLVVPAANRQDGQSGFPEQHGGLEFVYAATAAEALSSALARHRLKGYLAPS